MEQILYVDACVRKESRTRKLAEHFLKAYTESHPDNEIQTIKLIEHPMSYLTEKEIKHRNELLEARAYQNSYFRYATEFARADKIIIAAPFWDLSFPAMLRVFIETCSVDHITFASTPEGLKGLCAASKMLLITTRGGDYSGQLQELETGTVYLSALCKFFGIDTFSCLAADGLDIAGADVNAILSNAFEHAKALAKEF